MQHKQRNDNFNFATIWNNGIFYDLINSVIFYKVEEQYLKATFFQDECLRHV